MRFSATEAAFEGFRVVRRHPIAVVFWALLYIAAMAVGFLLVGPQLPGLLAAAERFEAAGAGATAAQFTPVLQAYLGIFVIALPLSLVTGAVLYAGVARAVLRPEEKAFGYLRFGMDEVRVLIVSVVLALAMFTLTMLVMAVLSVLGGLVVATGTPALWVVVGVLALAGIALAVWLAVRFSLAIPITVAEARIAILDSFALTRGRFWPLLGMAVLAGVMSMVVGLLGALVFLPVQLLTGGAEGLAALDGESLGTILQQAGPAIVGWIVVNAIMAALQVAVVYAPFSAAYRDIKAAGVPV